MAGTIWALLKCEFSTCQGGRVLHYKNGDSFIHEIDDGLLQKRPLPLESYLYSLPKTVPDSRQR